MNNIHLKSKICRNKKLTGAEFKATLDELVGGGELLHIIIVI